MKSNSGLRNVVVYGYSKRRYIRLLFQTVIVWCILCIFFFLNDNMKPDFMGYLFFLCLLLFAISPVLYFNSRLPKTIDVGSEGLEFHYKHRTEQLPYRSIESISYLPPSATILRKFPYSYVIVQKSGRKIEISSDLYAIQGEMDKDFLQRVKKMCPNIRIQDNSGDTILNKS